MQLCNININQRLKSLLYHLADIKFRTICLQTHCAFMMAICFWEATFGYKSYHLSDCYRLYISCKNNIRKALKYQTDLSDWYQLYISCKTNIETPITLSNRYETISRNIFLTIDDGYSCNHAEWGVPMLTTDPTYSHIQISAHVSGKIFQHGICLFVQF